MSIKMQGNKFTNNAVALSVSTQACMEIKCNKCGYKEPLSKGDNNFSCIKCPQCDSDSVTISSVDDSKGV